MAMRRSLLRALPVAVMVMVMVMALPACGEETTAESPGRVAPSTDHSVTTSKDPDPDREVVRFVELTRLPSVDAPDGASLDGDVAVAPDAAALNALWSSWGPQAIPPVAVPRLGEGDAAVLVWGGQDTSELVVDHVTETRDRLSVEVTVDRPASGCGSDASLSAPLVVLAVPAGIPSEANLDTTVHRVPC